NFSLPNRSFIVSVKGSRATKSRAVLLSIRVAVSALSPILTLIFIWSPCFVVVLSPPTRGMTQGHSGYEGQENTSRHRLSPFSFRHQRVVYPPSTTRCDFVFKR